MKEIVIATNNKGKIAEIENLLKAAGESVSSRYKILSLNDIDCHEDIPETGNTFAENAMQKASYVATHYGRNAFADDSGLEVYALNMEPGVYSARYSGQGTEANIDKLLYNLKDENDRKAQFHTVVVLLIDGVRYDFEGICTGHIINERRGEGGFGYDPVFVPDYTVADIGSVVPNTEGLTFAQMGAVAKNVVSHRGKAVRAMVEFLVNYNK